MKLTLNYFEVQEAVGLYVEKELGLNIDMSPHEYPTIEYQNPVYTYKKYNNGKTVKSEYGYPVIDNNKTKYETKDISFDDNSQIIFYIGG